MMSNLALHGGTAIRPGPWFTWPQGSPRALANLAQVLESHRWSSVGIASGYSTFESRFSEAFAEYIGVKHCITTASGTSALKIALEAADVGWGDEVIIPGLTWVADIDAVLSVGAIPILADVDLSTFCLDPEQIRYLVSSRTRAVIVVHLNGAVADVHSLQDLCNDLGIVLIEDASQAHGSHVQGQRVGSFGSIGAFSMHSSKLMTCGEGGAITTSSDKVALRSHQLRANGRVPSPDAVPVGTMEFVQMERLTGTNACLSEFQLAVLYDMLERLDEMNESVAANAVFIEERLTELGFKMQNSVLGSSRTYYNLSFGVPESISCRVTLERFASAIYAECGISPRRSYQPLNATMMVKPDTRPSWRWVLDDQAFLRTMSTPLPNATRIYEESLSVLHPFLRGTQRDVVAIVDSFEKVVCNIDEI